MVKKGNKVYAFPYMGDYTTAFKSILGTDRNYVITKPNKKTIELGEKYAPEFICFPYKITLGNIIQDINKGATHPMMVGISATKWEGECRLAYYMALQKILLKRKGANVNLKKISIEKPIRSIMGADPSISLFGAVKNALLFFTKVYLIDCFNKTFYRIKARAEDKKEVDNLKKEFLLKIGELNNIYQLFALKGKMKKSFIKIKTKKIDTLRVGIFGEIYLVNELSYTIDIANFLNENGVEVDILTTLSHFLKYRYITGKRSIKKSNKITGKYIQGHVGGHGLDSTAHIVEAKKRNYDGLIHLLPFGCMPEVSVRPILNRIAKDKKVNFLSLSLDEQTGKAGLETRLEAFIDMIKQQKGVRSEIHE